MQETEIPFVTGVTGHDYAMLNDRHKDKRGFAKIFVFE
jgi:hypothetical protein